MAPYPSLNKLHSIFLPIFLFFALVLLFPFDGIAGQAEVPASVVRSLRFVNLKDSSLSAPVSTISAIEQDERGFIWMGSQSGVYRHDGRSSTIYRNDAHDPHSLPGDYVRTIYRDSKNRLWFGTNKGLAHFNPASNDFTTFPSNQAGAGGGDDFVGSVVEDGQHRLWVGTAQGLHHFDPESGHFETFRHDPAHADSLASDRIEGLARDAQGGLWVGAWPEGVDYLAPGSKSFRHYRLDEMRASKLNGVNALCVDAKGRLWIGTGTGVVLWQIGSDWGTRRWLPAPAGTSEFWVFDIYEDRHGTVWVGAQSTGLLQWDDAAGRFVVYRHRTIDPRSLPSNGIYSIFVDRSDTLWVGSRYEGVAHADLASGGFGRVILENNTGETEGHDNVVDSISRADAGHIWLGEPDGLHLFDTASGKVTKSYIHDPARPGSLSNNYVRAVLQQPGGPLWVGTADGLNRFDAKTQTFQTIRFQKKEANAIRKMLLSRDGGLWLGTEGGVLRYDPRTGQSVQIPNEAIANRAATAASDASGKQVVSVNVFLEDRRGRLWVGNAYGLGINVRDPVSGKFAHYRHADGVAGSLPSDMVRSIFEDRRGGIWIGTLSGLIRVRDDADGIHFETVAEQKLSSVYVESIEDDADGMLWLAGVMGNGEVTMIRVDPASGETRFFYSSDGIDVGDYYDGAALQDGDGTLYFGSMQGFSMVWPKNVRSNGIVPDVAVVDLRVANHSLKSERPSQVKLEGTVDDPQRLTLPWDGATFAVEFAAMHFANPERNRYAYRLEGFDPDWIYTDSAHRVATYTNLAPGNYALHIKASNNNGIWGERGLTLNVVVPPPFWVTWWFRITASLAALGLLAWAYRWRMAQLERRQTMLEQLVQQRTQELSSKNLALSDAYAALENLSVTDPLTGALNRRFIEQRLPDDLSLVLRSHETVKADKAPSASIIFFLIDLDHFKSVNDRYGHAAGDEVLVETRKRLQEVFRESDYLVRWGGEEFMAVARDTNPASASLLAGRVLAAVADTDIVLESGTRLRQTCSVGYAAFPFSSTQPALLSWQQVLKLADLGLYAAKRSGRAAWVGLSCGIDGIEAGQVQDLLRSPGTALRAGILKAQSSVGDAALEKAWDSLLEEKMSADS